MISLDRKEFLKAIKFLSPAISESEESNAYNCLHLRVVSDKVILTAGDGYVTKKVPMIRPADQITIDNVDEKQKGEKEPEMFMIPLSTILAFETLVKKHGEKAKKLGKSDSGHLYVEVGENCLESFGVEIQYNQPVFKPYNFEAEFEFNGQTTSGIVTASLNSKDLEACNKGFDGSASSPVEVTYCGDGYPLHFFQEKTDFEALLVQRRDEEKTDGDE